MSTLVIVESPSKAKTIAKFLPREYTVRASVGHVRDLPKSDKNAIDIEGGFVPHYVTVKGKEPVVSEIKKLAAKADEVVLATDPDREGEAIAWHIATLAKLNHPKRIVFHEITKRAIEEAIAHPRAVDADLVRAQEARRVLDRLVGYELSGLLWKKLRYGLSAGRVQSPALRILVEREREIRAFVPEAYWVLTATTATKGGEELVLTGTVEPKSAEEAEAIVQAGQKASWHVASVVEEEAARKPRPPFTTSTLQQAASSRLGYSPSRTMQLAQKLYEQGHITYMRTDSVTLADDARAALRAVITDTFGASECEPRAYKTKSKNAQEAHEAIRPTDPARTEAGATEQEKKLYRLIRARTLASQMRDARLAKTTITAETNDSRVPPFRANGSRVVAPGWLAADPRARGEDVEVPRVKADEPLALTTLTSEGKETTPPSRYSEAGLVKELEKRGIGRPSTYAAIIHTLLLRKYVERMERSLKPTETGEVVSGFLEKQFANIVSDEFTAGMEENLDAIARGEAKYVSVLGDFYTPFHAEIVAKGSLPRLSDLGAAPAQFTCPICGGPMVAKLGKSGRFYSCEKFPACKGSRTFAGEEIAPPRETGETCPECKEGKLIERTGRFGAFIGCDRYPKCRYIRKDPKAEAANETDLPCPTCGEGKITRKRGRFGWFFGCTRYPSCKFTARKLADGTLPNTPARAATSEATTDTEPTNEPDNAEENSS